MKLIRLIQRTFITTGLLAASAAPASAALYYNAIYTIEDPDNPGSYILADPTASWSGDGSIAGPAAYETYTSESSVANHDVLTGVSNGTLTLGRTRGYGAVVAADTIGYMDIAVTGGGSVNMNVDAIWASAGRGPNNFGFGGFTGNVESFSVTFSWSNPLAATYGGVLGDAPVTGTSDSPFLAAFRDISNASYDLDISYQDVVSSTDGETFYPGIGTTDALEMSTADISWDNDTSSFSGTSLSMHNWQGLNGLDPTTSDGIIKGINNDGVLQDVERIYASGITFTVSRANGASFDSTDSFIFSTNGTQWADSYTAALTNVIPIPEPSVSAILGLGGLALVLRRKRS